MLGHLKPHTCSLSSASQRAYKKYYCSICSSLRKQNNVSYTLFINNELTLVLLALQPYLSVQTTITQEAQTRCPALAFTQKNAISLHPAIDLAAQLSVLLGWIKVTDWAYDRPHFAKNLLQRHLNHKVRPIFNQLTPSFQRVIQDYVQLTQSNTPNFSELSAQSGVLSYHIVQAIAQRTDVPPRKLEKISELFRGSGQLILLTDHLVDLTKDRQKQQYNPIISLVNEQGLDWNTAYYTLKRQFNQENYRLRTLLQYMLEHRIVHSNFAQAFRAALRQMELQIIQHKPDFIADHFGFANNEAVPLLAKNECCDAGCCEGCGEACGEGCCECSCRACGENCSKSCCCGQGSCCSYEGLACTCCTGSEAGDIGADGDSGFDGFADDIEIDGWEDGREGDKKKKKPDDEQPPNVDDSLSHGSE